MARPPFQVLLIPFLARASQPASIRTLGGRAVLDRRAKESRVLNTLRPLLDELLLPHSLLYSRRVGKVGPRKMRRSLIGSVPLCTFYCREIAVGREVGSPPILKWPGRGRDEMLERGVGRTILGTRESLLVLCQRVELFSHTGSVPNGGSLLWGYVNLSIR